jgi:hypothetical protein
MSFHRRYLALVDEIERKFPVTVWKCEDFEIWPLARTELYLDMYWADVGTARPEFRPFPLRSVAIAGRSMRNLWVSRNDLRHLLLRVRPADAVLLGDGVSIDRTPDGAADRFGEPVMRALQQKSKSTFLMQPGDLSRLPWLRATYAANLIYHQGAPGISRNVLPIKVPDVAAVSQFLLSNEVLSPSMTAEKLAPIATRVFRTAAAFERLLRTVKPSLAFVVNYYANLGPAFMLACRRQAILSVDLQHCPQGGTHQSYLWAKLPANGYPTLPAVFWNWTERDAANIRRATDSLAAPWHQSVHGGHSQFAAFLDHDVSAVLDWDRRFRAVGNDESFEKEVLIALQPVGNYGAVWDAVARQIEAGPATWRWWIRRHPASTPQQDVEFGRLLSLQLPNVVVAGASALPLPALLRNVSAVVSLFSGAAAEAAMLGVPSLFLSEEALARFSDLINQGGALIADPNFLISQLTALNGRVIAPTCERQPPLEQTLGKLQQMAVDYRALRRG